MKQAWRRPASAAWRIVAAFFVILFLFVGGEALERATGYQEGLRNPRRALGDLARRIQGRLPRTGDAEALLGAGLPVYDLRIRAGPLGRLHRTIDAVRADGRVTPETEPTYERAYFRVGEAWTPIRVKLRGWEPNHFDKQHPSLRLRFPSRRLFHGKRQINLIDPYDKFLTADVTTAREAARHGILVWENRFVVLRVNDEVRGLYLEMEQPGRELVERHDRSEGPIVSPNGKLYGKTPFAHAGSARALDQLAACTDPLAGAPDCDWAFFASRFDVDKLAWAAALMALTGHWGAWVSDNLRFYFDPARGRFEPIPWDWGYLRLSETPVERGDPPWAFPKGSWVADGEALAELGVVLMRQPEFRRLRDERLWTLIETRVEPMIAHADALYADLEPALAHDLRPLGPEGARSMHEDFASTLRANAALLRTLLSQSDVSVQHRATAGEGEIRLRAQNRGKAAIGIEAVRVQRGGRTEEQRLDPPIEVPGRFAGAVGTAAGRIPVAERGSLVGVVARNLATGELIPPDALRLEPAGEPIDLPRAEVVPPLDLPPGVRLSGGEIRIGPGRVELAESLFLPPDHRVVLEPDLDLRLGPDVSLLVEGDLEARGSRDRPVRIRPRDEGRSWGTVAVLGTRLAPRRVSLEHVVIEGGRGDESLRVPFTGALSVHDGIVTLRGVTLRDVEAEDALNVRYGEVEIDGCRIEDVASDAIDLDFCTGRIAACHMANIGGDGIDLSGSQLLLEDNEIRSTGDKGVSVGERSRVTIRRHRIARGTTGVAVKDGSSAEIVDSRILDQEVGIGVYVKKHSFGGASVVARGNRFERVGTEFLRDPESSVVVEGESIR